MVDEELLQARGTYWKSLKTGFYKLIDHVQTEWEGPEAPFYRHEKRALMHHLQPVYSGLAIAGVLFVTFRFTGSRWFAANMFRRPPAIESKSPASSSSSSAQWKGHLEQQAESTQESAAKGSGVLYDLALSLICGASSTLLLLSTTKLQEELPQIPLLPGKCLTHTTVCPELLEADRTVRLKSPNVANDTTIQAFKAMIQNCELRTQYIEQQRRSGNPMYDIVPYPGLRRDR